MNKQKLIDSFNPNYRSEMISKFNEEIKVLRQDLKENIELKAKIEKLINTDKYNEDLNLWKIKISLQEYLCEIHIEDYTNPNMEKVLLAIEKYKSGAKELIEKQSFKEIENFINS